LCFAGVYLDPFNVCATDLKSVLIVKVDLPLPETPVIQVSVPRGISQSTFLRLLPSAFIISIYLLFSAFLLLLGISIFSLPDKY